MWSATLPAPCPIRRIGFQSTHSVWSATHDLRQRACVAGVSIHALRVECDPPNLPQKNGSKSFNPRTPCGVRRTGFPVALSLDQFQSTHSVWSATMGAPELFFVCYVSIHALRVECDTSTTSITASDWCFNPRTPCGVRPVTYYLGCISSRFNPRTPCGVRLSSPSWACRSSKFQSTHSVWSATRWTAKNNSSFLFQSTHSVWSAT